MSNTNLPTAVIIDTVSIQQYVFSSSKLSINLGASYNVATYFKEICKAILGNDFNTDCTDTNFRESKLTCNNNETANYYTGYIGGGNALIFFENEEQTKCFIRCFSLKLLQDYPGLTINYGIIKNFDVNPPNYNTHFKDLIKDLIQNKNNTVPLTQTKRSNIAATGSFDNQAATNENSFKGKIKLFSSSANSKQEKNKTSIDAFNELYKDSLHGFTFPKEFEDIGLREEQGHLAVIHLDGNGFGNLFQQCNSLEHARSLSKAVDILAKKSITALIEQNILFGKTDENEIRTEFESKIGFKLNENYLPFRPIVVSGDDITFVCDGLLGIYLAEKCIEHFTSGDSLKEINDITNKYIDTNSQISACAGVAIIKRKFPFIKSYNLAEQLCKAAKEFAKKQTPVPSALEYHVANTGFAGTWSEIKESYYQQDKINLHYGPYFINNKEKDDNSIAKLKAGAAHYLNTDNWSKSKLADLKRIVWESPEKQEIFLEESKLQKSNQFLFGKEREQNTKTLSTDKKLRVLKDNTDYCIDYDRIELTDFYPNALLK